jgi:hypothetical protein
MKITHWTGHTSWAFVHVQWVEKLSFALLILVASLFKLSFHNLSYPPYDAISRVWRCQRGNQNPLNEDWQTAQWQKEKRQKDKQRPTKHTHKTKDRVARTPLKTGGKLKFPHKTRDEIKFTEISVIFCFIYNKRTIIIYMWHVFGNKMQTKTGLVNYFRHSSGSKETVNDLQSGKNQYIGKFISCWLILSVYILMSFDFPFVRLFGVR